MRNNFSEKSAKLKQLIGNYGNAMVAFSGGTDSTLLLKMVADTLGVDKVLAVTTVSPLLPAAELIEAKNLAKNMGVAHLTLSTGELNNRDFIGNSRERCYLCKQIRYSKLLETAEIRGYDVILDGTNAEDELDFRPGIRALDELGVKTPLREAGLSKAEIRMLAKTFGLNNWQKPSAACLASRIPYGITITEENLLIIEKAEAFLKGLGLGQLRVRHHGNTARIEAEPDEFALITAAAKQIAAFFKSLGYIYTTLDLQGFRSGSLNEKN
ncbi:ExsB family protein [Desulfofarcimen acetoxidans DSM 771]|uniref:ExsB family protein n=1 Tax=Desulfofarcimen acetoxidans (strain ATCC 49208 / DSM 771 / KCTC 5769 / VKM B-1644 / 5575) TaxID=485916 RepID=C8VZ37_DESAS|nr:ATP-dependent sacrificial sulfur transferase LarE [Desulfofarcimen acetoxidans]ACV62947.1 ExsB family protein [Desulfofarcimen acetoxidans DSM 771]